jgi:hypothetical protein
VELHWRSVRAHRGQRHMSGWYWSATTAGHVVYESRLELARLLLADFDPDVVGIAAQPFLIEEAGRCHVPDFLLRRVDASVVIVNVKPSERLADERVAELLAWAGRVFADRGWEHEVWSGANAVPSRSSTAAAGRPAAAPTTACKGPPAVDPPPPPPAAPPLPRRSSTPTQPATPAHPEPAGRSKPIAGSQLRTARSPIPVEVLW